MNTLLFYLTATVCGVLLARVSVESGFNWKVSVMASVAVLVALIAGMAIMWRVLKRHPELASLWFK